MKNEMSLQDFHNRIIRPIAEQKGIPYFGGFELTPRCNLSCKMCYVKCNDTTNSPDGKELSTQQWIEIGKEAIDNGTLVVFLTGGEPLFRKDFKDIYDAFCQMGFRLNIFTNGTLITEEFAKWLSQRPPASVDVTIYGANETTYYNLCGQKEAYKKTLCGVENLLKYNITTRIKTTVVRTNASDYKEIKGKAMSYGVEFLASNLIHGNRTTGLGNIEAERLSPDELYEFNLDDIDMYDCKDFDFTELKGNIKNSSLMSCSAGKSSFFINWRGEMVPCALFETPFTEPLKIGYKNAWLKLREEIKKIPEAYKCLTCESRVFCPTCSPRLLLESGKFDGTSNYLCELAKGKERLIKNLCNIKN